MVDRIVTQEELAGFTAPATDRKIPSDELSAFQPVQEPTLFGEAQSVASQFNQGAIDTAKFVLSGVGFPIELLNEGLKKIGLPVSDRPFGGSRQLTEDVQRAAEFTGVVTGQEPQTGIGQFVGDVAEFAGASALPLAGALGQTQRLQKAASPLLQRAGTALLERPGAVVGAEALSSLGAATGQEVAGELAPGSQAAQIAGSLVGGVAPGVVGPAVKTAIRGGQEGAEQALREFQRVGVDPTAGQISQGGAGGFLQSTIAKIPGGRRIIESVDDTQKQLSTTIKNISGDVSAERAGRVIREGLFGDTGFTKRFSNQAGKLFNKLDDKIPAETKVPVLATTKIFDALASPIAGAEPLSRALSNPKVLQISDAFVKSLDETGTLPFKALKDTRSAIGRMLSSSEVVSQAPRAELKRIYAAISQDLGDAATNAGAIKEFNRANNFYKAGINRVDDFLDRLAKKAGTPEDIFIASTQGKNGASKIRAVRRSLKPDEWEVVARTHLSRLGRATGGRAGELDAFSSETFFTNLAKMSPEARSAIFGGVKGLGKSVDDLSNAAARMRAASRTSANPSGTALGTADIAALTALTTGAATGSLLPIVATAATVSGANIGARLFENPAFVKWLATSSNVATAQIPGHLARLNVVAKENPDIAEDINILLENINDQR